MSRHRPRAERERRRHGRCKTFGDGRDGHRDADEEGFVPWRAAQRHYSRQGERHSDPEDDHLACEPPEATLERGGRRLRVGGERRDETQLRAGARLGHEGSRTAPCNGRPRKDHRCPLCQGGPGSYRRGMFRYG